MVGVFVSTGWLCASLLAAAEWVPPGVEAPPLDASTPHNRNYAQAAMTKIRPGSYLQAAVPPYSPAPELRGELGKERDEAVQTHYARLAELDVLADGAQKEHDERFAERIESVRRKETQRFFRALQRVQLAVRAYWERRLP